MNPLQIIVWAASIVFVATCCITVAYLAGYAPKVKPEYGKHLISILIVQIVLAGVGAFAFALRHSELAKNQLPVERLMLVEQAAAIDVLDGSAQIFIRAKDVARTRRIAELQLDLNNNFTSAINTTLKPGEKQIVTIGSRRYELGFSTMGKIDSDPNEKHGKDQDFIFLSMRLVGS